MALMFVLAINSDLSVSELMVTFWIVTESGMATEFSRPGEDVFRETCVSTLVPAGEPNHVEKFTPVGFGIGVGLLCGPVPVVPLGADSRVPSGVPKRGLVQALDGGRETLPVVAVPFVGDVAGAMDPVGRRGRLMLPLPVAVA